MNTTTQCVWLQGILGELRFTFDSPTLIRCDNESEIKISIDPSVETEDQAHRDTHAIQQDLIAWGGDIIAVFPIYGEKRIKLLTYSPRDSPK